MRKKIRRKIKKMYLGFRMWLLEFCMRHTRILRRPKGAKSKEQMLAEIKKALDLT